MPLNAPDLFAERMQNMRPSLVRDIHRAYVEAEYSWPAVTARLRDTLERLVA